MRHTTIAPAQRIDGGVDLQTGIPNEVQLNGKLQIPELSLAEQQELRAALLAADNSFVEIASDDKDEEFWSEDRERVFLVGAWLKNDRKRFGYSPEESLEELGRLADTAGLKVVGSSFQLLESPNNATYIGSGKVAEVARAVRELKVETVIFDDELSPGQQRNLERQLGGGEQEPGVNVADRTALILDIFSQRAQTREGKLQVELAQVEYQLPRLTRMWTHLDRVGGGGQVKGTGEKQIETDKRLLRDKAAQLKRELESVRTHRRNYRNRRSQTPIPVVALVGYTNAGKSTLLNTLTNAGVLAEDKLFATLDPTTRKVRLARGTEVLVSDTVGFIQKLPTQLVAAFRATLEEIQDAGVILHVVDISHPNAAAQCRAVLKVLDELQTPDIPIITAWNKVDACADPESLRAIARQRQDTVCVSGKTGEGLEELLSLIGTSLEHSMTEVEVLLPYIAGDLLDDIHTAGSVRSTEYRPDGSLVTALVPRSLLGRLRDYSTTPLDDKLAALAARDNGSSIDEVIARMEAAAAQYDLEAELEDGEAEEDGWMPL